MKNIKLGMVYPPYMMMIGTLAFFGGFGIINLSFSDPEALFFFKMLGAFIGIAISIFGLSTFTSINGVLIDEAQTRVLVYTTFLGYKRGKWRTYSKSGGVTILSKRMKGSANYRGALPVSFTELFYNLCLLDETHLRKIILMSTSSSSEAIGMLSAFSRHFNLPKVNYKPKRISKRR